MVALETKRLLLRRFQSDDAADVYAYACQPEIGPNAGWKPLESLEQCQAVVTRWHQNPHIFALYEKQQKQVIGSISLYQCFDRAVSCRELGYVLNKAYWHQGYMSEAMTKILAYAFETLDVVIVQAKVHEKNLPSQHLLEKNGFVLEGCRRQAFKQIMTGEVLDVRYYSLFRKEWKKDATMDLL